MSNKFHDFLKTHLESNSVDLQQYFKETNLSIQNEDSRLLQLYDYQTPFSVMVEKCNVTSDRCEVTSVYPGYKGTGAFSISSYPNYENRPLHQHNTFEIMFVLSGCVTNHVENHVFNYQAGQCCFMTRNIKHCESFSGDFQAIFIQLKQEFAMQIFERDLVYFSDGTCQKRDTQIYKLLGQEKSHEESFEKVYLDFFPVISADRVLDLLEPIFQQIISEMVEQKPGYLCMVQSLFSRFFSYLEDPSLYSFSRIQTNIKKQEYLFIKMTLILEANHGRISRKELADALNYNSDYLNRIVKQYTSMNLTEYGQSFCLEEARNMLINTDMTISDIIHELRFSNRSHFYHIFEQKYGSTPNQYRKVHQRRNNNTT